VVAAAIEISGRQLHISNWSSPVTPPREKSSSLFSWACAGSAALPGSPPGYSEIKKELLARQDAARFEATSGA
jgi:hypothetical protein